MSRKIFIALLTLVLGGCRDNSLRFDTCQLRAAAGEVQDGGVIGSMDGVRLRATVRGCQSDSHEMCKAKVTAEIRPASKVQFQVQKDGMVDQNSLEPTTFKKNSDLTSLEVSAEAYSFPPGEYTVTIKAEDLVANKTLEKKIKFTSKS